MTVSSQQHHHRRIRHTAHIIVYGVYWYFYSPKSMGFAATSSVRLITADLLDNSETDSNRLSWHLDQPSNPSWRAGTAVGGSTYGYYKVVMYCN